MTQRKNHLDLAKGITIIIVVYGHAINQLRGTLFFEEHLQLQSKIIFSFIMPVFFIIAASFQRIRLESLNFKHKTYLKKITKSILLPFYSLSLVFLCINVSFKNYINAPSVKEMLYALFLQQSNGDLMPSGVLYFLFTLFIFTLTTYFSFKILKISPIVLIILAIILRSDLNIYSNSYYFAFDRISRFFIFYMFGYYYKSIINFPIHKTKPLFLIFLSYILLIMLSCDIFPNNSFILLIRELASLFGAHGLLAALFVLGVSFLLSEKFNEEKIIKILTYYGALSLLVYVFHMPTFKIINIAATTLNLDPGYIKVILLFLPGILFPLIYGKILSNNKLIYQLLLGRNP